MQVNQLIPMRFLIMMGHLVLLILLLWDRDDSVKACIPWDYMPSDYNAKNNELVAGFSISIALLVLEFIGFMSGITMFCQMQSLFSSITHSVACISLSYFITDVWDCVLFWWIFVFCSLLPAFTETIVLVGVLAFKKL